MSCPVKERRTGKQKDITYLLTKEYQAGWRLSWLQQDQCGRQCAGT